MRHDFLDRQARRDSPVHRLPAAVKLGGALLLILTTIGVPRAIGPLAGFLIMVAVVSKIPPAFLLKRLLLLEPFVLGVAVLALAQPHGGRIFLATAAKSTLCLATAILLANTTPFSELLRLLRRARLPALLITTLALLYRYLFVLIDEAERMRRARACRTFTRRRPQAWQALATVIGQLFVRSTERAERIYAAMCARGWK